MSKDKAEEWAEEFLNSEEGLKAKEQFEKDFLDYAIFGRSVKEVKDGGKPSAFIIDEAAHWNFENTYKITVNEIIDKYSGYLTEEQLEELKNYGKH